MINITVAKTAGFCFGVARAVNKAFELADKKINAVTLGPIIHNPQIVKRLEEKGIPSVLTTEDIKDNQTVIIRSHGVPLSVYDKLSDKEIVDCTCPFVLKIHKIVKEQSEEGKIILIAGNKDHPEVQGIKGHCKGEVYTFETEEELFEIFKKLKDDNEKSVAMVAQTTFNKKIWKIFQEKSKKLYTNLSIFDTICSATDLRQQEAVEIAQKSDYMIVIGGKESSNTRKLYEICKEYCKTVLIETKSELDKSQILCHSSIGITAGASTPADIIKEVLNTMSEIIKEQNEELDFAELLEQSLNEKLYTGKRVKGIVTTIAPNEIHVDVGAKQAGIVPSAEISDDPNYDFAKEIKKGDEIQLMVLKVNDQEGIVTLSKKRCDAEAGFDEICKAHEEKAVLTGTITDVVRGGVLVLTNNTKIFIPSSMVSDRRIEDLNTLLKTEVQFRIVEINDKRRRAVGSAKSVLMDVKKAKQEEFWANVEVGKVYNGEVKSTTSYGAFVDLGGVDGMVHITELSWTKIKSPEEVVKVGDIVEVYVKDIDAEKKKISLGYKKTEDNPWEILKKDYPVDSIIPVKIVSLTTFGAFAQVIPGVDGLIHISQIANKRIDKVADVLKVGDVVDAKIMEIDFEKKKVNLSIRATLPEEVKVEAPVEEAEEPAPDYAADLEGIEGVTIE